MSDQEKEPMEEPAEEPKDAEAENDKLLAIVINKSAHLAEHFDTVQIFCTKQRGKNTFTFDTGSGNWYARYGQVREWSLKQEKNIPEE